jgi:hypothetical protein
MRISTLTNDNYWLHLKLKNNKSDEEVAFSLETSRPIVDIATFYKISEKW